MEITCHKLGYTDQQRFQLHNMDDAAECLENILNRLHFHFAMNEKDEICSAQHCISHRKFAMEIMEQSTCVCGATSEPLPFSQLVHYVSVSALCHEADVLINKLKGLDEDMFGHLLKRAVNQGDLRACPDVKCGKMISVQQTLLNCPDVVCIGLIWDSESPEVEQITQLLDCIDPVLRLPEVFPGVVDDTAKKLELLLAGVVTYYGKHYSTFFYSNKLRTWIYFDDARVRKCGSEWETIREKCCQNHYQPLLLLYVNPHGRAVNTKTAPAEVKLVDTKTLLASDSRTRSSFSNEKTNERRGSTLSVVKEHKGSGDAVDGLLSSSSSHSVTSDRGSENDMDPSTPDRKKRSRSLKKLRGIGSDIKRALSRSRNNSPNREENTSPSLSKREVSRVGNNSPILENRLPHIEDPESRTRNNSPTPKINFTGSSKTAKTEDLNDQKSSCDDLISFIDDPKPKSRRSYHSTVTSAPRGCDEVDSGLGSGSSQASSPAASSVSSVDTASDDLIDFTTKTSTLPRSSKAYESQKKLYSIVSEAESFLRSSYELEKGDLELSLSMATQATGLFRMAADHVSPHEDATYRTNLKNRYNICLARSRHLHGLIERNNNATTPQFSAQEKQLLIRSQKERDQQIRREMKQTPAMHGTLPRSTVNDRVKVTEVVPMPSRPVNDLILDNCSNCSDSLSASRKSRGFSFGSLGNSREELSCTQKIKPDALCYSPVHYGKTNTLNNDFQRLTVEKDSEPTLTHVSTSFIPVCRLQVEQMLSTSTVLPNSRNLRNTDIRRRSIYDNMPPSEHNDPRMNSNALQRTLSPPPYPNNHPRGISAAREGCKSWNDPVYIDPPPYKASRTYQATPRSQPAGLLERFNVPMTSEQSASFILSGDARYIRDGGGSVQTYCSQCKNSVVEKNFSYCQACRMLKQMLYNLDHSTMQS